MILDVDQTLAAVEQLLPWNLKIRVGGVEYSTRPPTVGELAVLESKTTADAVKPLLVSLFTGEPAAPVATWGIDVIGCVLSAILLAFKEQVEKNSRSIARETARAMGIDLPAVKKQAPSAPGK